MPDNKKIWKFSQELVGIVSAAGTLLLGIVTLWVTIKVSGFEDYLRSEIKYRNEQLVSATETLRNLQHQQSALQENIGAKTRELATLQRQVTAARSNLAKVSQEDQASKANLDVQLRSETYQILEHAGFMNVILDSDYSEVAAKKIPIGEQCNSAVLKAKQDTENAHLVLYIEKAEQGFRRTCPSIYTQVVDVPAGMPTPEFPQIKPKSNKVTDFVEARDIANKEFSEKWKAAEALNKKRHDAISGGFDDFYKTESACLCNVLSTHSDRTAVCRVTKLY